MAVESTRGYVADEPIKSLLIAAAVGAAVIALVEMVLVDAFRQVPDVPAPPSMNVQPRTMTALTRRQEEVDCV